MAYRRLFVISRAALLVIVGLLMTSGSGAARQAAPASPPSAAVSTIAPDDEIRRILVKRIDTDKQSLGIVVGILEPKGSSASEGGPTVCVTRSWSVMERPPRSGTFTSAGRYFAIGSVMATSPR